MSQVRLAQVVVCVLRSKVSDTANTARKTISHWECGKCQASFELTARLAENSVSLLHRVLKSSLRHCGVHAVSLLAVSIRGRTWMTTSPKSFNSQCVTSFAWTIT